MAICISAPISTATGKHIDMKGISEDWVWILMLSLFGFIYQMTLARGSALEANPAVFAMINSFDIVITYFLNIYFMGVKFEWIRLIGSMIVVGAVVGLLKFKYKP